MPPRKKIEDAGLLGEFRKVEKRRPDWEMDSEVIARIERLVTYISLKNGWKPDAGNVVERLLTRAMNAETAFTEWEDQGMPKDRLPAAKTAEASA